MQIVANGKRLVVDMDSYRHVLRSCITWNSWEVATKLEFLQAKLWKLLLNENRFSTSLRVVLQICQRHNRLILMLMAILYVEYVEIWTLIYTAKNKMKQPNRLFIVLRITSTMMYHYFMVSWTSACDYKTSILSHCREDSLVSRDSSHGWHFYVKYYWTSLVYFLLQSMVDIENKSYCWSLT